MSRHNDEYPSENGLPPQRSDNSQWWEYFENDEDLLSKEVQLKDKYAFAISVDESGMPKVNAMGRGLVAEKIRRQAEESGLPVERDPDMVRRLFRPSDDRIVPARVYGIIAEILTFVYQLNELASRMEMEKESAGVNEIMEDGGEEEFEEELEDYEEYYEN